MLMEAPLVWSLSITLVYDKDIKVAVCPEGHESVVGGGLTVTVPWTLPFLSAVNCPLPWVVATVVVFLASEGILPPPLTHESTRVALALHVIVTVVPSPKPDSLKIHARLSPLLCAVVADLIK